MDSVDKVETMRHLKAVSVTFLGPIVFFVSVDVETAIPDSV
jgi:hypothetical protein